MADDTHETSQHEPGTMDIAEQEKTFNGFMRWVVNGVIVIIVALLLLAIVGA